MQLQIQNLTRCYGTNTAVDHVSFTLTNGVYGLLGENGAGKSTLMRLLCGLLRPDTGEIRLNGKAVSLRGEAYTGLLGYLPQNFSACPDFTAREYLRYAAVLKGLDGTAAKRAAEKRLKEVGLLPQANRRIKTFSGGMRQRLGIAQAMLNDPGILILDEPTAGLDPKERIRFRNLISAWSRESIVLLSTHIVSDVEFIADEVILFRAGQILHFGKPEQITAVLNGRVWECRVDAAKADAISRRLKVSNLKNESGETAVLRVISEEEPLPGASGVKPTLEDLYLYYFESGKTDAALSDQTENGGYDR